MESNQIKICDKTIENYRYATQKLRYDGDYINHFCALINGYKERNINAEEIKKVRSLIKEKSTSLSPFRGDILYILSFLLVENNETDEEFIDDLIKTFDELIENDFYECGYLVLSAYAITRYIKKENRNVTYELMKNIFFTMKEKYNSCTRPDDYLLCALLAIEGYEYTNISEYIDYVAHRIEHSEGYNNNVLQGITSTVILYNTRYNLSNIFGFIKELENNDLRIGQQFLNLIGMLSEENSKKIIIEMKEVLQYLSEEEPEYYYYMDKDFSNMIAFVIVFMSHNKIKEKYVDEIIAFGVYCFLMSKNAGIINEILA